MAMRAARATPKRKETEVQRSIVRLLTGLGWVVYSTSQGYRKEAGGTRMTPGIPDLWCFHPQRKLTLWVEVKPGHEARRLAKLLARPAHEIPASSARDVRRAVSQQRFGVLCTETDQPYAYGEEADVVAVLRTLGFQFPKA